MLHQITRFCSNYGSVVVLLSSHTQCTDKHSSKNNHTDLFPQEKNQFASHPLLSPVISIGPIRVIYSILIFVLRGQIWRKSGGGPGGGLVGVQRPGMLIGEIVLIRPSSLQMLGEG